MRAMHIHESVIIDARRQLETAARRLRAVVNDPEDEGDCNKRRLADAIANIHAALARLER